jgi:heme-degrading monooxygenase HmoA
MVRLFVRHNVDDYEAWRRVYDEFDAQRGPLGVKGDAVFRSLDDPNDVTVWHDFDSDDAARAFVASSELRDAMQQAGVRGEPQIWLVSPS